MRRPAPARRPGIALIAVLGQLTLLFMAWSLANRQGAATTGLEEAITRHADRQRGSRAALAIGLGLLEAGDPDPDRLDDRQSFRGFVEFARRGAPATYVLTFTRVDEQRGEWAVSAEPFDAALHVGLDPIQDYFDID